MRSPAIGHVRKARDRIRRLAESLGGLWQRSAGWRRSGWSLLYPPRCAFCDADLAADDGQPLLCGACREAMVPAQWRGCPSCAGPVPAEYPAEMRCPLCHAYDFHFDAAVTLGVYRDKLSEAVRHMKREFGGALAVALGGTLCLVRGDELAALEPDCVVPVPMFWTTRLVRKVNGPDLLAARVAGFLRIPVYPGMLRRTRKTRPQKELQPNERFRNVAGSFGLVKGYDIKGARIVLVDDVLTTGATCDAAARVLKQAGASRVAAAVLARGIGDRDL
jgi:ComF family protein